MCNIYVLGTWVPGNNVPLLRGAHNYLCGGNLLLGQLVVSGQLGHGDVVLGQPFTKVS